MRNILPFVGILCFLCVAGFKMQAETRDPTNGSADVEELEKRISSLEEQLASIEERVQNNTLMMIRTGKSLEELAVQLPRSFPGPEQLPKGSVERDFNGMHFYLVPLDHRQK